MPITPNTIFNAFCLIAGMYVIAKYGWMVYYQAKYGGDYGERYIRGEISKEEKAELRRHYR